MDNYGRRPLSPRRASCLFRSPTHPRDCVQRCKNRDACDFIILLVTTFKQISFFSCENWLSIIIPPSHLVWKPLRLTSILPTPGDGPGPSIPTPPSPPVHIAGSRPQCQRQVNSLTPLPLNDSLSFSQQPHSSRIVHGLPIYASPVVDKGCVGR